MGRTWYVYMDMWMYVRIYVYKVADKKSSGQSGGETHWVHRASLVDSRTSVNDAKFAPRHLGLMLVSIININDVYFINLSGYLLY